MNRKIKPHQHTGAVNSGVLVQKWRANLKNILISICAATFVLSGCLVEEKHYHGCDASAQCCVDSSETDTPDTADTEDSVPLPSDTTAAD